MASGTRRAIRESEEGCARLAGRLVDAPGEGRGVVFVGVASGNAGEARDGEGAGLGGDGAGANASEALEGLQIALGAIGLGPGEEVIEREVVLGGEREKAEVRGEELLKE